MIKYIWRYNYKIGLQDLQKAEWYLKKLIEVYKAKLIRKFSVTYVMEVDEDNNFYLPMKKDILKMCMT